MSTDWAAEDIPAQFLAFIPECLDIPDRPELCVFPAAIVFSKTREENTSTIIGTAIYCPDFHSLTISKTTMGLLYRNELGGTSWVHIRYYKKTKSWKAQKRCGDKTVETVGTTWQHFFTHVTMLGLQNGESCELRRIDRVSKRL